MGYTKICNWDNVRSFLSSQRHTGVVLIFQDEIYLFNRIKGYYLRKWLSTCSYTVVITRELEQFANEQ